MFLKALYGEDIYNRLLKPSLLQLKKVVWVRRKAYNTALAVKRALHWGDAALHRQPWGKVVMERQILSACKPSTLFVYTDPFKPFQDACGCLICIISVKTDKSFSKIGTERVTGCGGLSGLWSWGVWQTHKIVWFTSEPFYEWPIQMP